MLRNNPFEKAFPTVPGLRAVFMAYLRLKYQRLRLRWNGCLVFQLFGTKSTISLWTSHEIAGFTFGGTFLNASNGVAMSTTTESNRWQTEPIQWPVEIMFVGAPLESKLFLLHHSVFTPYVAFKTIIRRRIEIRCTLWRHQPSRQRLARVPE